MTECEYMPSEQHVPSPDPRDGSFSPDPSTRLFRHLTDPPAFLSALPLLAARSVDDAVIAVILGQGGTLGVLHGELDHLDHVVTVAHSGVTAMKAIRELSGSAVLLAGFGPPERVDPHVKAFLTEAASEGVPVLEALRVTGGRYWSYLCEGNECCPAGGRVFTPRPVPFPDLPPGTRSPQVSLPQVPEDVRIATLLEPVAGVAGEEVAEKAAHIEERVRAEGLHAASRRRWVTEVLGVLEREETEWVTDPRTLAMLGVRLLDLRVRDAVWARITRATAPLHLRLWSRVARHVPRRHRAAPAALSAVAAWQGEDEPLARAAVRVALEACPGYGMAVLMERALSWGLPPGRWADHMAEYLEETEGGEEDGFAGPAGPPPR